MTSLLYYLFKPTLHAVRTDLYQISGTNEGQFTGNTFLLQLYEAKPGKVRSDQIRRNRLTGA